MKKQMFAGFLGASVLAVSACGGGFTESGPKSYKSVPEMVGIVQEKGETTCSLQMEPESDGFATEIGRCVGDDGEAVYSLFADRSQVDRFLSFAQDATEITDEDRTLAVGENWTVRCSVSGSDDSCAQAYATLLGGTVWRNS